MKTPYFWLLTFDNSTSTLLANGVVKQTVTKYMRSGVYAVSSGQRTGDVLHLLLEGCFTLPVDNKTVPREAIILHFSITPEFLVQ